LAESTNTQDTKKPTETQRIDQNFKYEIMNMLGTGKIHLCFQCGTCTADCVIARFTDFYRPRKIAHLVQLGLKDKLVGKDDLWLCTTCHTCVDHCPQGVEVSSIIRALRNTSIKSFNAIPFIFKVFVSNILKTGYIYLIPESRLKKRKEQELPPLPKINLEDINILFQSTGFLEILEKAKTIEKVKNKMGIQDG